MTRSAEIERALLVVGQDHEHLFYIRLGTVEVIFRTLTLAEADTISRVSNALSPIELNDWMVERCVVYSTTPIKVLFDGAPAGYIDRIAQAIIDLSGFNSLERYTAVLDECRAGATTVDTLVTLFICKAFPKYTPSDVRKMTIYEQLHLVARAEMLLGKQLDLNPEDRKHKGRQKTMSPEVAAMLSEAAADKPDIKADNKAFRQMATVSEQLGIQ